MKTQRVAVLGGGVAGCIVARQLSDVPALNVDIIEREPRLGGLHRTVTADGLHFDIGAFVFGADNPLFATFDGLRDLFCEVTHHPSTITPNGTVDRFPITPRGYFRDHTAAHATLAAADLILSKARYHRRDELRSFLRYYVGDTLYRDSGLKDYVERFYMIGEDEIDLAFARQRLASMADAASLRGNLARILRSFAGRSAGVPWRCFVRPADGFDIAYGFIGSQLEQSGVSLRLNTAVESIRRLGTGYLIVANGCDEYYDRVIATIPVTSLVDVLGLRVQAHVESMSLLSLFFRFHGEITEAGHYFYNFTSHPSWKRLVLFSRYYGTANGDHYFTVECTRNNGDRIELEESAHDVMCHLQMFDFFRGEANFVGGCVTDNAYPILRRGHVERLALIRHAVENEGIELVGRQATFRHQSSHQVGDEARATAARIVADAR